MKNATTDEVSKVIWQTEIQVEKLLKSGKVVSFLNYFLDDVFEF